jgi:DNA-binding CsgD family transcriptional regulator
VYQLVARLGIGRGTARSYLGQVFQKTDTHSRAALTALVNRFPGRLH